MSKLKPIKIEDRLVGPDQPVFIVAEVGINHNGDMALAKESIDAAAEAGADSVKFQNYHVDDFVTDRSLMFTYKSQGKEVTESQYEMFLRNQIDFDDIQMLKEHCDKRGVVFHSTPTNQNGIDDLVKVGTDLMKNGSDFLSNVEFVSALGETGLATILSTGMAIEEDIAESVDFFRRTGNDNLIVLQCTSNYPTAPEDVHLAKILSISEKFDCLSGLSDHTVGTLAGTAQTVLGGCLIEKHFTLDKNFAGPDHWFSCDPQELETLVRDVRAAENLPKGIESLRKEIPEAIPMIGSGSLELDPEEAYSRENYRLSCVASKSLSAGHTIEKNDVMYQRPGTGWRPSYAPELYGKVLNADVERSHIFNEDDFR